MNLVCQFTRCRNANIAIPFALTITILMGFAGAAIDFSLLLTYRSTMQGIADASALAGARELNLAQSRALNAVEVAKNFANGMLAQNLPLHLTSVNAALIDGDTAVKVNLTKSFSLHILSFMDRLGFAEVGVEAIARVSGFLPICIVALDEKAPGTLYLEARSHLTAENCAVYSNSKNPSGIKSVDSAFLKAALICSAGGKVGKRLNFSPEPLTDCPVLPDPLAARPAPPVGPCAANGKIIDGLSVSLVPGTYCGGLKVVGGAKVKLQPGVYIIKDGPLIVDAGAIFEGENVGFYFTGDMSTLLFGNTSTINLTAPIEGPLAGILLFEDRSSRELRKHNILSDNARTLLGTIYFARGRLIIDASKPIADKSAYTIIVSRRLELYAGPNLVLNSNYGSTTIPVPAGVGRVFDSVVLAK